MWTGLITVKNVASGVRIKVRLSAGLNLFLGAGAGAVRLTLNV